MAVVNRYTTGTAPMYNPMSMQELAFAPQFLRQRHDETNAAAQMALQQLGEYNVHSNFQDAASQLTSPIEQGLATLGQELSSKGVTESGAVNKLMELSAQQKQLFSPRGGIGQLQQRTQQFQESQKQIQDFFKDNPEIAQYKLSQANIGDAQVDPETGQLQLGDMSIPNYVRHIADEDIMKQVNDAVRGLKPSDLAQHGISYAGRLGSFNDLYQVISDKGLGVDRIQDLIGSLIGPEIQQSVSQYGEVMGYSPEESLGMLEQRLAQLAGASAYTERDRRYFNIEDKAALDRFNSRSTGLTVTPGPLIKRDMVDIIKTSGLKFNEKGDKLEKDRSINTLIKDGLSGLADIVSLLPSAMNPINLGLKLTELKHKDKIKEKVQEHIQTDFVNSVDSFRQAYPEFVDRTNAEVYEAINNMRNDFSEIYSKVVGPQDADFGSLHERIIGVGDRTGDFGKRAVYVNNMMVGTGDEFYKQLGYSSFREFKEEGAPQIEPGITFGGKSPAALVGNAVDSDGNHVSFTIESPEEIAAYGQVPNQMLNYISQGKFFNELSGEKAAKDFNIPVPSGESLYYLFDLERNQPVLVQLEEGLTPKQVMEQYRTNPDVSSSFADVVNEMIEKIFYKDDGPGRQLRKKK